MIAGKDNHVPAIFYNFIYGSESGGLLLDWSEELLECELVERETCESARIWLIGIRAFLERFHRMQCLTMMSSYWHANERNKPNKSMQADDSPALCVESRNVNRMCFSVSERAFRVKRG